jgi:hypothetical protein
MSTKQSVLGPSIVRRPCTFGTFLSRGTELLQYAYMMVIRWRIRAEDATLFGVCLRWGGEGPCDVTLTLVRDQRFASAIVYLSTLRDPILVWNYTYFKNTLFEYISSVAESQRAHREVMEPG